jgi:large subunit ribosomal protein L21
LQPLKSKNKIEMYAIVDIAGQQFKVAKDQKVYVHRLDAKTGTKVSFDQVLLLDDGGKVTVGAPAIANASVDAKVVKHLKDDKVIVFKKKRRKGYRVKNGHRQSLTEIVIESIGTSAKKKASSADKAEKEAVKAKPAAKKETAKAASKKAVAKPKADLSTKTVAELKAMAKEAGISGYRSLKKAELIAALSAK